MAEPQKYSAGVRAEYEEKIRSLHTVKMLDELMNIIDSRRRWNRVEVNQMLESFRNLLKTELQAVMMEAHNDGMNATIDRLQKKIKRSDDA